MNTTTQQRLEKKFPASKYDDDKISITTASTYELLAFIEQEKELAVEEIKDSAFFRAELEMSLEEERKRLAGEMEVYEDCPLSLDEYVEMIENSKNYDDAFDAGLKAGKSVALSLLRGKPEPAATLIEGSKN